MNGYSSHTYKWYNAKGEYFWVQYHFKTDQGIKNLTRQEAGRISGQDPDHATRDLYAAIARGDYPSWTLEMQILTPEQAKDFRWDILDITKVWPHGEVPPIKIGKLVLNRNPVNYFAEVEQAAFCPGNLVPGIAASPDKMLQARLFSYHDTHIHRLGPNYHLIPVNAPKSPRKRATSGTALCGWTPTAAAAPITGPIASAGRLRTPRPASRPLRSPGRRDVHPFSFPNDDFVQPGDLYRKVMTDQDRKNLVGNIVDHLGGAAKRIQLRQTALFFKADPDYGRRVAAGLGLEAGKWNAWPECPMKNEPRLHPKPEF